MQASKQPSKPLCIVDCLGQQATKLTSDEQSTKLSFSCQNKYLGRTFVKTFYLNKVSPSPRFATKRFFLNNGEREKTYLKRY